MSRKKPLPADKKTKLVRQSFKLPAPEWTAIETLKARAITLGTAAKKSELLRAGLKLLLELKEGAYLDALGAVSSQTRRRTAAAPATPATPSKVATTRKPATRKAGTQAVAGRQSSASSRRRATPAKAAAPATSRTAPARRPPAKKLAAGATARKTSVAKRTRA